MKYKTILIDPPWDLNLIGEVKRAKLKQDMDYPTMSIEEIQALPIEDMAADGCHLWMWVTNQHLPYVYPLLKKWGFKYLNTLTWVKNSGIGMWFINRTEFLIFAYRSPLKMNKKFCPNIITEKRSKHSKKPYAVYTMIESISDPCRIELFARHKREGWDVWGNQAPTETQMLITNA